MVDLVVKNGQIVGQSGTIYGSVAVEDSKITFIGSNQNAPKAKRVVDAKDNFVIPGLVDPHVHVPSGLTPSDLEETARQQLPRETEGALHGGVTSFGHMVVILTTGSNLKILDILTSVSGQLSYVDYFMHAGITSKFHLDEQEELWRRGVTSFKHFFNAFKGEEGHGILSPTDEEIAYRSLLFIAEHGYPGVALFHCEEIDPYFILADKLKKEGRNDLKAWTEARPGWLEAKRVRDAIEMAVHAGNPPLYIVHMSAAESVDIVAEARRNGYLIYGETCPHYLTHTCEIEEVVGCWGKVVPPIRYAEDRERLWRGIRDGGITNIGTDHCPWSREDKEGSLGGKGKHGNIWKAGNGICAGMQHTLPVMMTFGVNNGRISIEDMVRICSTNTAKVFGLYPSKGVLALGSDADIVIVDPDKEVTVNNDFYHCMAECDIYLGWKFRGLARTVIIRGEVMMEDYETVGKLGHGRFLARRPY